MIRYGDTVRCDTCGDAVVLVTVLLCDGVFFCRQFLAAGKEVLVQLPLRCTLLSRPLWVPPAGGEGGLLLLLLPVGQS